MIPLKTVFQLRGGYAIRWYELLVAKRHLGTFRMDVEVLRAWLGLEAHELPMAKDLRARALDVPKKELDLKADLSFTYRPIKVGRRITGWTFTVKPNRPRSALKRREPLPDPAPEPTEAEKRANLAHLAALRAQLKGGPQPAAEAAA